MPTNQPKQKMETTSAKNQPAWLTPMLFEELLKAQYKDLKNIIKFRVRPALTAGENYATIVLRIEIEFEECNSIGMGAKIQREATFDPYLAASTSKQVSYLLKLPHDGEAYKELLQRYDLFQVELNMFDDVVPELEQIYRDAGLQLKFGPRAYKLQTNNSHILLEDLRPRSFRNANRFEGLDIEHAQCVLKKLAQWHAASAKRVELKGNYEKLYQKGYFTPAHKSFMEQVSAPMQQAFLECAKDYKNNALYLPRLEKLIPQRIELTYQATEIDENEFNVLNHGDLWCNNIMFQYDAFGKIKETYLVDYQLPKYGSPAQDLFYFLVSSTKLELKVAHFDNFVSYYHQELVKHLALLKYAKKMPMLMDLHKALFKHGIWAYTTATGAMAAALLNPMEQASFENIVTESAESAVLKNELFSNARYRKHIETVLPWLLKRGSLEGNAA